MTFVGEARPQQKGATEKKADPCPPCRRIKE